MSMEMPNRAAAVTPSEAGYAKIAAEEKRIYDMIVGS